MRKRWFSYSGILSRTLSSTREVFSTQYEVYNEYTGEVHFTAGTRQEAVEWIANTHGMYGLGLLIREVVDSQTQPAQSRGAAIVPVSPLPLFTRGGKVLATRGYWDVRSTSEPQGRVSNFAFGMLFMPVKPVLERTTPSGGSDTYQWRIGANVPDPLLDDPGFFAYGSFVRVTTDVNQDPPFYSKTRKRFSENSVLCVIGAVEVGVDNLQHLSLDLGIRFRVLVEF